MLLAVRTPAQFLGIAAVCSVLAIIPACRHPADVGDTEPLSPEESLATLQIVDGFRVELFAAEPHVVDPVDLAFDENGGVWIAELLDYPNVKGDQPRCRIKFLEDRDGDGVIDRHTVFADGLHQVSSVLPWKDGILATVPPEILFFRDTDGDHVADERKVVHAGFTTLFPQRQINNLRLGLDNWIYVANRGQPGEITSPDHPGQPPVFVRGLDFRFHPGRGLFEPETGNTQFGVSFDEWGNRFLSENTQHLRHAVIPYRYLARNPFVNATMRQQEISDHGTRIFPLTPPQQWRVDRTQVRSKRYSETQPGRVEQLEGHFTASSGATVYLGDAFPPEFVGNVFVSDNNGNLVHRDVLTPNGATFSASREPKDSEFLASTDNWFRPVNFKNAPDGNLYVVDYYRQYIEHSNFVPDAVQQRLRMDFFNGDDRGRIYRIVPENPRRDGGLQVNLGGLGTEALVRMLSHPNAWHRRTAQRLLVDREDPAAVPELQKLVRERPTPQARLHALWTLEGLSALETGLVSSALEDPHPGVRENAVRLSERFVTQLTAAVVALADDSSPKVQFQVALSLGNLPDDARAFRALTKIVARHAESPWFRLAATSAPAVAAFPLLSRLDKQFFETPSEGKQRLVSDLSRVVGARRNAAEVTRTVALLAADLRFADPAWRSAGLTGLAAGLKLEGRFERQDPSIERHVRAMVDDADERVQAAGGEVAQYFELPALLARARGEAADSAAPIEKRVAAVRLLRGSRFDAAAPLLREILTTPLPQAVQQAAAQTAASFDDASAAALLLAGWKGYVPETRRQVVDALLRHRARVGALLDAIESGVIEPFAIDAITRIRLAQYPDEAVQQRAGKLFDTVTGDRAAVVAAYEDVLAMEANAEPGKESFERECAKCHLRTAERGRIGPDLSGVNNQSREALLASILDPSAAIEGRFTNYLITTNDGRLYDGLLIGETSATVTIRGETEDTTLLRKDVEEIRASNVSLMPEGLEEALSRQELADVIGYLRAGL